MGENRTFRWDAKKIANEALFGWLTFTVSVLIFATASTILTVNRFSEEESILMPFVVAALFLLVMHGLRHSLAQAISRVRRILSEILMKRGELLRRFKKLLVLVPELVPRFAPTTVRDVSVILWPILAVLLVWMTIELFGIQLSALLRPIFLFLFILACAIVIIIALVINPQLRARIRLPGRVEFYIDTSRPGWKRAPKRPPIWGIKKEKGRRYQTWLVAKVRGGPDWEYELDVKMQVYIGRRADNDIVLRDPATSRRHAVIYLEKGRYWINNLSKKGTKVNNRWITKNRLSNGCKIKIGNTELIFREAIGQSPRGRPGLI